MRFPILPDTGPEANDHATLRYDRASKRWVPGPEVDPSSVAAMQGVIDDYQTGQDATDTAVASVLSTGSQTGDALAARTVVKGGDIGRGGRGMMSLTIDDALPAHFSDLLPLSIEMGFPLGTAWHTDNGQDAGVAAAHAAGWEVLSHLPGNVDARTLTESQLITQAESSLNAIEGITGTRDGVGFVYPMHYRNANTDRILSRYYSWGRGAAAGPVDNKTGHPWLVSAYPGFDTHHDEEGNLDEEVKGALRAIAAGDMHVAFYGHYGRYAPARIPALINLVNLARSLGIQIVRPSDIRGSGSPLPPRILASDWSLGAGVTVSTEKVIRAGESSLKVTPNAAGGASLTSISTIISDKRMAVGPTPGMFTLYRASCRYHATAPVPASANWGFGHGGSPFTRSFATGAEVNLPAATVTPYSTLPAADWGLLAQLVAVGPEVTSLSPRFAVANILAGGPAFYLSDFKWDRIDTVASLVYEVTLNGTNYQPIQTGVLNISRRGVALTPRAPIAGQLYYTIPLNAGSEIRVQSTDPADVGQVVQVTVTPGIGYLDYAFSTDGA